MLTNSVMNVKRHDVDGRAELDWLKLLRRDQLRRRILLLSLHISHQWTSRTEIILKGRHPLTEASTHTVVVICSRFPTRVADTCTLATVLDISTSL